MDLAESKVRHVNGSNGSKLWKESASGVGRLQSLADEKVRFTLFDRVRVEPTKNPLKKQSSLPSKANLMLSWLLAADPQLILAKPQICTRPTRQIFSTM